MSHDEPPILGRWEQLIYSYTIWLWVGPLVLLLLALALYFAVARSAGVATTKRASSTAEIKESGLETARQGLSRQTDLNACRKALQQINAEMGEKAALRPPAPTKEQADWLRENLHLSKEEMSEVETSHYTRLDQHHLFGCFLMRDAAANLQAFRGTRGKVGAAAMREKPLDQAARAFDWVMRQVRLRPAEGEVEPPSFVLRRGSGSALERALIFLALLEQLGDPDADPPELLGFLLDVPDDSGARRLWTCGVVERGSNEVHLFDPTLGLPLPGPNGQGIATLAQVCEKAEILAQLSIDKEYRYPATGEQARAAQAQLVCPLSALAPRMRSLQSKLAPAVHVRLAIDAGKKLERIKAACSTGVSKAIPVQAYKDKCTLLSRFLPSDEGGVDTANREQRFMQNLIPWVYLPRVFQDERLFPQKSELGMQVRLRFAHPFFSPMMEAGQSRDLLLRGRYNSAVEKLVSERAGWRSVLSQQANSRDLEDQFRKWLDDATRAYAELLRAKGGEERQQAEEQVKKLWTGSTGWPVQILLNSSAAAARSPEVAYQLGLCSQEQAEQLQARLDLQTRAGAEPNRADVEKARSAWQNVLDNWKQFEEDNPKHPDLAAALRLRGRAESMLGDRKAALAAWKKVARCPAPDLEKLAALFLAKQAEKQPAGKAK